MFNVTNGKVCGFLGGHEDKVTSVVLNEKNHLQLVSTGLDGQIVTWDIGTDFSAIKVMVSLNG